MKCKSSAGCNVSTAMQIAKFGKSAEDIVFEKLKSDSLAWWRLEDDESNFTRGANPNDSKVKTLDSLVGSFQFATVSESSGPLIGTHASGHKYMIGAAGNTLYFTPPAIVPQPITYIWIGQALQSGNFSYIMGHTGYQNCTAFTRQDGATEDRMQSGVNFTLDEGAANVREFFMQYDNPGWSSYGFTSFMFHFNGASSYAERNGVQTVSTGNAGTNGIAAIQYQLTEGGVHDVLDFAIMDGSWTAERRTNLADYINYRYGLG